MKDVPENELFSAYLDGELTAAEQAEVEQLLARSPAARQLLEDLRALSSKLQALPQYKLGEDLSREVLGVAERRVLTTPAPTPGLARPAPPPRRAILRRLINSRALVWSSLAVAVAVILTVVNRGPQNRPADEGIAQAPAPVKPEQKGGGAPEIAASSQAGQQPDGSRLHRAEPVLTVPTRGKGAAGAELADQPAPARRPAEARDLLQPPTTQQPSPDRLVMKKAGPAQGAPGGPSKGEPPSQPGLGGGSGNANGAVGSFAAKGDRPQIGKGGAGYGMKQAVGGVTGSGRDAGEVAQFVNGGQMTLAKAIVQPAGGYAVVCCDISPTAFLAQAFAQVLAVNGIALEGTGVEAFVSADTQTDAVGAAPDRGEMGEAKQQRQVADVRLATVPLAGELDLVCVEATREQLEATLAALDAQPGEFLSLSVEPAPGVEAQKDWGRQFGRNVQQEARRRGGVLAGQADDSAHADAMARPKVLVQEEQAAESEAQGLPQNPSPPAPLRASGARGEGFGRGNQASLGRAWRLQVPGPVLRGRLSAPAEPSFSLQSGTAAQQAGPAVPAPAPPEVTQALRETPAGAPLAERTPELPGPAEGEGKSATPGTQSARSLSQNPSPPAPLPAGGARGEGLGRGSKPPAPAKPAEKALAPAEQPKKSPNGGPPQDESPRAGSGGRAVGHSGAQGGAPTAGKGPAPQAPGSPQPKVPPPQLADKSQEGRRPGEGTSGAPPPQDQAKEKSAPQEKREQRQDLKQPPPPTQTYRVLFVLRMVGPGAAHMPAAAASIMERAEPPAARDPEGTPPAATQRVPQ